MDNEILLGKKGKNKNYVPFLGEGIIIQKMWIENGIIKVWNKKIKPIYSIEN